MNKKVYFAYLVLRILISYCAISPKPDVLEENFYTENSRVSSEEKVKEGWERERERERGKRFEYLFVRRKNMNLYF